MTCCWRCPVPRLLRVNAPCAALHGAEANAVGEFSALWLSGAVFLSKGSGGAGTPIWVFINWINVSDNSGSALRLLLSVLYLLLVVNRETDSHPNNEHVQERCVSLIRRVSEYRWVWVHHQELLILFNRSELFCNKYPERTLCESARREGHEYRDTEVWRCARVLW